MYKKKEILELYNRYADKILVEDEEILEIKESLASKEEELLNTFSEDQKKIFNNFLELQNERNEMMNKNVFISGFSLATKLFSEGLK